jgi:enediyne biosynthesis protein E4
MTGRTLGLAAVVAVVAVLAIGAVVVVVRSGSAATPPVPRFVEVAADAGVDQVYDGDFDYFVGGGVAAFDCDGDGLPELFFAGGSEPAALYRNRSVVGGPLRFERVVSEETSHSAVSGGFPLDIDSDGLTDLVVVGFGGNTVLRGLGDCRFEAANERFNVPAGRAWTVGFSATWESGATLPTLAFGNYLVPGSNSATAKCDDSVLLRQNADGTAYGPAFALHPGYCTLSILFSDWNRTGRHDLRMSNDRHYYSADSAGEEQLWRIEPGEAPRPYTAADGWRQIRIWGMGIASQDLTGDGMPEVFLTSQADNKLQTLIDGSARPTYGDIAVAHDVTATRPFEGDTTLPSTAWHPEFQDVNNDGLMDLFVSKGNVEAQPDYAMRDPSNLLIGQPDGTFVEGAEEAGIVTFARARGAALVDLNMDGLLDLVQVNRRTPVQVWQNMGAGGATGAAPMGNWLGLRIRQLPPNRDGIGAWIDVKAGDLVTRRQVTVGGGHAGGQLGWIHFGLGDATEAEVRITWPDGGTSQSKPVAANQYVTIDRGTNEAIPWSTLGG